jgi:hypothetical protein
LYVRVGFVPLSKSDAQRNDPARPQQIERMPFLTAKTPRPRREQAVNKKKEEFDQVVEQVTDAILKVHRPLGPLF